eukprot:TRINITY_DN9185_c0_g1_i1.p1 TRINITY_DN9185_c0_g1~~TRINITY_DN9185_c0_g1_i1.p1  ORF type:complete len:352 (-),score=91.06 TRINITY_DN9185_c0_g1_i1:240-1295(-)
MATDKPIIQTYAQKSLALTVYDTKWVPMSARFVVLGSHPRGTGALHVYQMNKSKIELSHEAEKRAAFKCGTFAAGLDRKLATGDFDGRLALWDLEHTELPVWTVKGHDEIINAIDGCKANKSFGPELATSSRDGKVKMWDPRTDEPVAVLAPAAGAVAHDCWAVAFGNNQESERMVCAGYANGDVKLYDLRANKLFWETNVSYGVCSIEFDRKDIEMNKMAIGTLQAQLRVYDMRTFNAKTGFASLARKIGDSTVWCVRHLPQNRDVFMVTGGTGSMNIFKYSYPAERFREDEETKERTGVMGTLEDLASAEVSTQPVLSFDWHPDKQGLCVFGALDQTVRIGFATKLHKY